MLVSSEELISYQSLQMKHDGKYHHEILVLGTSGRMNHIALHLMKYLATLSSLPVSDSTNKRAFIDSFIMTVSACNLLGISLEKQVLSNEVVPYTSESFIEQYIIILGKIAKACEATDHQEDYPIRSTWNESIRSFIDLLFHESTSRKVSLLEEASSRLAAVERKNPLNNILQ